MTMLWLATNHVATPQKVTQRREKHKQCTNWAVTELPMMCTGCLAMNTSSSSDIFGGQCSDRGRVGGLPRS